MLGLITIFKVEEEKFSVRAPGAFIFDDSELKQEMATIALIIPKRVYGLRKAWIFLNIKSALKIPLDYFIILSD